MMTPEKIWLGIGFFGQAMFTGRFLVQWLASEIKKDSVIPSGLLVVFHRWWRDIAGLCDLSQRPGVHRGAGVGSVGLCAQSDADPHPPQTQPDIRDLSDKRPAAPAFRAGLPYILAICAAFIAIVLVLLSLRPLLPIDETRYLSVAWEMWLGGSKSVPHLNGEIYTHKPPLLFWLINLVWQITGVSELAARLVAPGVFHGSHRA